MAARPSTSGIREDAWLARVLERPVYTVDARADLPDVRAPGFYWAKVPVADVPAAGRLCAHGFLPVDVNVTFSHEGAASAEPTSVRPARPEDSAALLDIADSCFRFSRFHLDPQFPDRLADRIKCEWVRSYIEGSRGIELLAAVEDNRPVGFLGVLETGDARVIDLIGVASNAQGHGHGEALVTSFVARHASYARELRVGTQAANVPSLRLYEKLGFRISSAAYVLHLHTA